MDTHLARQLPNDIIIRIIREATEADTLDYWIGLCRTYTIRSTVHRLRLGQAVKNMGCVTDLHARGYLTGIQYDEVKEMVRRATDEELDGDLVITCTPA